MRLWSRDEIQVGLGCRVSGGCRPRRLRRRQRAEWDVQGRRCCAAGERGTANTWMAPWPQKPEPKKPSSGESPEEIAARDPIYAEYRRRTADIEQEDDWGSFNKWVDEDKLGNLVVGAFDTAADAHVSFSPPTTLARLRREVRIRGQGGEGRRAW